MNEQLICFVVLNECIYFVLISLSVCLSVSHSPCLWVSICHPPSTHLSVPPSLTSSGVLSGVAHRADGVQRQPGQCEESLKSAGGWTQP